MVEIGAETTVAERAQIILDNSPTGLPNPQCEPSGVAARWGMMEYLKKERNFLPLKVLTDFFSTIFKLVEDENAASELPQGFTDFFERFSAWVISLVDPYFLERGWDGFGKDEEESRTHELMASFACKTIKMSACIEFGQEKLLAWMDNPDEDIPLHPMGRDIFLPAAASTIETRVDEAKSFIETSFKKANNTAKTDDEYDENFLRVVTAMNYAIRKNPHLQNVSSSSETALMTKSCEYLNDVSAKEALEVLGEEDMLKMYVGKQLKESVKLLLGPIVSNGHLKRLQQIRDKIKAKILDNNSNEASITKQSQRKENVAVMSLIEQRIKKLKPFHKCLSMIMKTAESLPKSQEI